MSMDNLESVIASMQLPSTSGLSVCSIDTIKLYAASCLMHGAVSESKFFYFLNVINILM